jgi:hypothetical protein
MIDLEIQGTNEDMISAILGQPVVCKVMVWVKLLRRAGMYLLDRGGSAYAGSAGPREYGVMGGGESEEEDSGFSIIPYK